jgi:hypothetical protein
MKTLSVTPRPWYCWKAEDLSFLRVLLVRGVTLTSLLIKKRQNWALVGACRNSFLVFVSDRSRSGIAENRNQIRYVAILVP